MFKKSIIESAPDKINTVIGKETNFKGEISGKGLIRVDGHVEGTVENTGDVIIGETGKITATLKARNITIAGNYEGSLEAEGKLELKKTATAIGTFTINGLIVEEGAVIAGNMEMEVKDVSGKKVDLPPKRDWSYKPVAEESKEVRQKAGAFADNITPGKI